MATKRRLFRVSEEIRNLIAEQLPRMSDPRLELVTVTNVAVSPDLRSAKIYWSLPGNKVHLKDVQKAFEGAEGLFKRILAKKLGLRCVPTLKFFYDDTFDTICHVEDLLKRARNSSSSSTLSETDQGEIDEKGTD